MLNLTKLYQQLAKRPDRLMGLMLLSLHAMLIWENIDWLNTVLFIMHYGLFLLWQPVMQKSAQRSKTTYFLLFSGGALGALLIQYLMSWWIAAFWIASLFSLIGGRIFSGETPRDRLPNLLAASYLLAILLLWVVPKLLNAHDDLAAAEFLLIYFLPILPLVILFLSSKPQHAVVSANIDFFYTLLLFLTTLIIILGSFAIGVIWQVHYIKLLIFAVMGLAVTLVVISWLWNPSATFSGLELLMSRYLLSIGLPFEKWIRQIALHAENASNPEAFLRAAMGELAQLNWVSGLHWEVDDEASSIGSVSDHISTFTFGEVHLTLFSTWQFRPAMYLHVQLLTQILGEFYEAKCREEAITQTTYMQTFYETGSRLTHDIKNILQSLGTLTAATQQTKTADDEARLLHLVKLQLPRLNQRLAITLSKLEQPSIEKKRQAKVANWWRSFKQLNEHQRIIFESPTRFPNVDVDTEMVDSVIDNLLQNALEKAKHEGELMIKVTLQSKNHFCVEVTDSGSAIPAHIAERLFKAHVDSEHGLGVGLFHAAQQAKQAGYILSLTHNEDGLVGFQLEVTDTAQL